MGDAQLDPILVGKAIAVVRQEKLLSQEVLSGLSDLGRTHLSAIERGVRKPTLETIWRLASALDMRPSDLVKRIEDFVYANDPPTVCRRVR